MSYEVRALVMCKEAERDLRVLDKAIEVMKRLDGPSEPGQRTRFGLTIEAVEQMRGEHVATVEECRKRKQAVNEDDIDEDDIAEALKILRKMKEGGYE